ncbi:ABC transporter ATP-binding protein [Ktedonosporobacter rubrisoli]|uniref:ABC transporter ATP-binding protein n=1 Tax=Ktedonosporobacter rubrisoli TaxID=2509675 RepID=A0A4P6JRG3_KTERU|nr:ABC transporter ATP-binding protein [Ktedonosporobacter rubrisoli]QBD78048.1 ABC transporter ATP-binding protein [Ktedonosporobacter rubrisoli]
MAKNALKTVEKKTAVGSPLLDIEDLKVYYNTISGVAQAVDGVNLQIKRGEILGIAGESGCGKSTLTTALLRLTKPPAYVAAGRILFYPLNQQPINLLEVDGPDLRAFRWRNLAYLPQGSMSALNPVLRVKDQFSDVMLEHSEMSKRDALAMVPDLLKQVGLEAYVANMYPHELSGGMKQRVTLAMAIALEPDLLVADEPTTALDVHVQRVIIQMLAGLRDKMGMTVIIVTHDMAVHAELADRVAVMYAGGVVEVGDVRQIFKAPKHPYTRGLIGSIPRIGGERIRLGGIGGNTPSPRNWPTGCRFHPRCPQAMPICSQETPAFLPVANEAGSKVELQPLVACHLYSHPEAEGTSR